MRRALPAIFVLFALGCATSKPASTEPNIVGHPPAGQSVWAAPSAVRPAANKRSFGPPQPNSRVRHVPGMSRKKISLDVRGADVRDVLRLLAREGDINIVVDPGVHGQVTMTLRNVSVEDAFLTILESQGLGYTTRGAVISVGH